MCDLCVDSEETKKKREMESLRRSRATMGRVNEEDKPLPVARGI